MKSLNKIINNTDQFISVTKANINNTNSTCFNTSIEILNDDCIENILSHLDKKQDLISCNTLNKRFCRIVENTGFLHYQLYFEKNCLSPQAFIALPKKYIVSIERGLQNRGKKSAKKSVSIAENSIHLKRRLFYSIEKNLSNSKKIDFQILKTITHNEVITAACFSKDNSLFATGSQNGIVKVFAFIHGGYQLLSELQHFDLFMSEVCNIVFSADNAYMITSYTFLQIWYKSIEGYIHIQTINALNVSEIYFRNDSRRLLIKSFRSSIDVFDLEAERCKQILSLYNDELQNIFNINYGSFKDGVELDPKIKNDSWLCFMLQTDVISSICKGYDDYVDVDLAVNIKNMIYENKCQNMDTDVLPIAHIVYSNDMKLMHVFNCVLSNSILEYTNKQWQLKFKFNAACVASCFSQDNRRVITQYYYCYNDERKISQITIWNITGNTIYKELVLNNIDEAKFSPNSQYIIAFHFNYKVTIWHLLDNAWRVKSAIQYASNLNDIYFSNYNWMIVKLSGKTATILVATSCNENTNVIESLTNNKKIICNQDLKMLTADNIFFATESNYFATTDGSTIKFWNYNIDKSNPVVVFNYPEKITNILFSPDNSQIIILSDFYITIYSFIKNKYDKKITIETKEECCVYFKSDGKKIIIAEIGGAIKALKLITNNWQQDLVINKITDALDIQNGIFINTALTMQFNDSWLSSILQIQAIIEIAYNKKNNKKCNKFFNFTEQINNIIYTKAQKESLLFGCFKPNIFFSKDNKLMCLGFNDQSCVILENNNNQWNKKLIFNAEASKAYFSQDNQRIITIYSEDEDNINRLLIWNITTDTAYQELGLNNISSASFSPDSTQMLTTSTEDNQVKIWSLLDGRWRFQQAITNDNHPCFANFSNDAKIIYIILNNKKVKVINISYAE